MSATTKFSEGDLVEAVKGESVLRGRVKIGGASPLLEGLGWSIVALECDGFTVTLLESASPKVELPTEPGVYVPTTVPPHQARIVKPSGGGWVEAMTGYPVEAGLVESWVRDGSFTRLEPVPVTAKAVIDFIAADHSCDTYSAARAVFGVVSE